MLLPENKCPLWKSKNKYFHLLIFFNMADIIGTTVDRWRQFAAYNHWRTDGVVLSGGPEYGRLYRFGLINYAYYASQIALLWWANGGPTVRVLMGQRWQPPVAHCGFVQRASVGPPVASHRWASVGPPLGQRWLATGRPLLIHRWPNGTPTISALLAHRWRVRWASVGPPLENHHWRTIYIWRWTIGNLGLAH